VEERKYTAKKKKTLNKTAFPVLAAINATRLLRIKSGSLRNFGLKYMILGYDSKEFF
jgi:hypothetical protein